MVSPPATTASPAAVVSPPTSNTLATTTKASAAEWRKDLQTLFERAKERFPDVVWELGDNDDPDSVEEVWGHKAIVYARAPPSFQARYFKFRPSPSAANPYGASPLPGGPTSSYSLNLPMEDVPPPGSRSPSPFATRRVMSPVPSSIQGAILRLQTNIAPVLFTNELEYLYTGKGMSDAFEFLFDAPEKRADGEDDDEARVEKLRNDLIYMWRSRLYSDVRVVLTGNFPSGRDSMVATGQQELSTAAFSSHKFILVSRSQYFRDRLQSIVFAQPGDGDNEIKLPSPPFTPASVHFTLGFIYTGTLAFSHRTYDLTTAFHIVRSALYLQMDSLHKEMEARLVEDMLHGLFHAFLPFDQYEKITAGRWGVGGCKCKQCQRRAPRVLEFAMSPDVNNPILTRGAQRALSGMFGEGWCSPEFAALPVKTRSNLVKGVTLRTNSMNAIPLLFAAQGALTKLENNKEDWAEEVREMIHTVRKRIDETMCSQCEEVFEQEEWVAILERDGAQFGDNEKVGWVMDSLTRGLSDKWAPLVYQTLVSAILLRLNPSDGTTLLPPTSIVRASVERARSDVVKWIGKKNRWQFIQNAGGFEDLDGWAVKEISDEIDIPVEALLARPGSKPPGAPKYPESETASISSFRSTQTTGREKKEATPSVHSISRASVASRNTMSRRPSGVSSPPPAPSAMTRSHPPARLKPILSSRVQSVATATQESQRDSDAASVTSYAKSTPPASPKPPTRSPLPPAPSSAPPPTTRPKSIAPSIKSTTSTIRNGANKEKDTLAVPGASRPVSQMSNRSTRTATGPDRASVAESNATARKRTVSNASAVSTKSAKERATTPTPTASRPRRSSVASTASSVKPPPKVPPKASPGANKKLPTPPGGGRPPLPTLDISKMGRTPSGSSTLKKPTSSASIRSTASSVAAGRKKVVSARKSAAPADDEPALPDLSGIEKLIHPATPTDSLLSPPTPTVAPPPAYTPSPRSLIFPIPPAGKSHPSSPQQGSPLIPPRREEDLASVISRPSRPASIAQSRSDGASTVKGYAPPVNDDSEGHRRNSSETITGTIRGVPRRARRGVTLKVGIPCIISSKRTRFRAFARYIGEVDGESGPWVGVEVPVADSWTGEKLAGRDWNDGSVNGTRYFEISGNHKDWDEGEQRAARRRRLDILLSEGRFGRKREGDALSMDRERLKRFRSASPAISETSTSAEVRGLFVRPQQVLYVVDAEH